MEEAEKGRSRESFCSNPGEGWFGLGQGCGNTGKSQKGSDFAYILKVDLTGFFHGIGVEEKESIKHGSRFFAQIFGIIDHTENPAGVNPSNLKIVT